MRIEASNKSGSDVAARQPLPDRTSGLERVHAECVRAAPDGLLPRERRRGPSSPGPRGVGRRRMGCRPGEPGGVRAEEAAVARLGGRGEARARRGALRGQLARTPGRLARRVLGRSDSASGPDGAAAPPPREGDRPFAHRHQPPRARPPIPGAALHRVDDRRRVPVIEEIHAAQRPESGAPRAPRRVGEHGPGPPPSGFSARPLGARLHRQRRGPRGARPAEPARRRSGRLRNRRAPAAPRRGARKRARMVGLRPRGPRPRPHRAGDRGRARKRRARAKPFSSSTRPIRSSPTGGPRTGAGR